MADQKISQLTTATTPLAGTEVLPVVQSGTTKKVAVSDLTAGRAVSAAGVTDTTKTTGSVLFVGASGAYSQNNTRFFWDDTNYRLGIGTTTPTGRLTIAQGSIFATQIPNIDASVTWNGAATTFTAWKLNVTDTDSANGSKLIDLQTNTASKFNVDKDGLGFIGYNLKIGTANQGLLDSTGTVKLNFSSTAVTLVAGNLVQGTAAKGVNFTANTPAAGMTSQLLNWYEEGTWTPTDNSGAGLTFSNLAGNCYYTRVGNLVTCIFNITYPATANGNNAFISGLPFTSKSTTNGVAGGQMAYTDYGSFLSILVNTGATTFYFWTSGGTLITNANASGKTFRGVITYMV